MWRKSWHEVTIQYIVLSMIAYLFIKSSQDLLLSYKYMNIAFQTIKDTSKLQGNVTPTNNGNLLRFWW